MAGKAQGLLWNAQEAAAAVASFIAGRRLEDYLADRMLRSAVERQCEIVGEALGQLRRVAPDVAARIPDLARAVGFRNLLIHGYELVDNKAVWLTVTENLPRLAKDIAALLVELDEAT